MLPAPSFIIRLFSLVVILSISACVTDHAERVYVSLPPSSAPPTILRQVPTQPFETIADVQWVGGTPAMMAQRAQRLGGDAVYIQNLGGLVPFSNISAEQNTYNHTSFTRMTGTVIRYKK